MRGKMRQTFELLVGTLQAPWGIYITWDGKNSSDNQQNFYVKVHHGFVTLFLSNKIILLGNLLLRANNVKILPTCSHTAARRPGGTGFGNKEESSVMSW
jgi:hypothetical protein